MELLKKLISGSANQPEHKLNPIPALHWHPVKNEADIQHIIERSEQKPCAIFKHSTRCSISELAKNRLERQWNLPDESVEMYFLDLLAHRSVSNHIAEVFSVHHESPQLILIHKGEAVYDDSHTDITIANLTEALTDLKI